MPKELRPEEIIELELAKEIKMEVMIYIMANEVFPAKLKEAA